MYIQELFVCKTIFFRLLRPKVKGDYYTRELTFSNQMPHYIQEEMTKL